MPVLANMVMLFPHLLSHHFPAVILPFVVSVPVFFIYGTGLCGGVLFVAGMRLLVQGRNRGARLASNQAR